MALGRYIIYYDDHSHEGATDSFYRGFNDLDLATAYAKVFKHRVTVENETQIENVRIRYHDDGSNKFVVIKI